MYDKNDWKTARILFKNNDFYELKKYCFENNISLSSFCRNAILNDLKKRE